MRESKRVFKTLSYKCLYLYTQTAISTFISSPLQFTIVISHTKRQVKYTFPITVLVRLFVPEASGEPSLCICTGENIQRGRMDLKR